MTPSAYTSCNSLTKENFEMHAKERDGRKLFYRTHYVRKGVVGNSHGYSKTKFVGSLPCNAVEIPDDLKKKLTPDELAYVRETVIEPAQRAADREREAELARERDPAWRVERAIELLDQAVELWRAQPLTISDSRIAALEAVTEPLFEAMEARDWRSRHPNPLKDVRDLIGEAAAFVRQGGYGTAPATNARATEPYAFWMDIKSSLDHDLLPALQEAGYVKRRTK
jgi:hypothetical protein